MALNEREAIRDHRLLVKCGVVLVGVFTAFIAHSVLASAAKNRVSANDDRNAAEQTAAIFIGKWSNLEDQDDSQLTRKYS